MARLVRGEGLDDLAQAGEGEVDALALSEGVPGVGADTSLPWDSHKDTLIGGIIIRTQSQTISVS